MAWQDEYKSKLCSHQEAAKIVKSGDRFFTALGLGEPSTAMVDAIADRKDELEDVQYISALVFHPYKIFTPEYRKPFQLICGFYDILTMGQHAEGVSRYVPILSMQVATASSSSNRRAGM